MKIIMEFVCEIDVIYEIDVLVVGLGFGGLVVVFGVVCVGVDVILVECFGCLGGNIIVVGVEGFVWYC